VKCKGWLWSLAVAFVVLPAIASPLLLAPIPSGARIPPWTLSAFVAVTTHARWWAALGTVLAVCGARRCAIWWMQEVLVAGLLIVAWLAGAGTMARFENIF
jgi:hypothetical protein